MEFISNHRHHSNKQWIYEDNVVVYETNKRKHLNSSQKKTLCSEEKQAQVETIRKSQHAWRNANQPIHSKSICLAFVMRRITRAITHFQFLLWSPIIPEVERKHSHSRARFSLIRVTQFTFIPISALIWLSKSTVYRWVGTNRHEIVHYYLQDVRSRHGQGHWNKFGALNKEGKHLIQSCVQWHTFASGLTRTAKPARR